MHGGGTGRPGRACKVLEFVNNWSAAVNKTITDSFMAVRKAVVFVVTAVKVVMHACR